MARRLASRPSRLVRATAWLGVALSAAGLAVALGVDQVTHSDTYTNATRGGPSYGGFYTSWVNVPKVSLGAISVAVTALAATLLLDAVPRVRRVIVVLLVIGSTALVVLLGFLLIA